jgi:hypothetical protein
MLAVLAVLMQRNAEVTVCPARTGEVFCLESGWKKEAAARRMFQRRRSPRSGMYYRLLLAVSLAAKLVQHGPPSPLPTHLPRMQQGDTSHARSHARTHAAHTLVSGGRIFR